MTIEPSSSAAPAPVSAEQVTGSVVFRCATYLAPVTSSPEHSDNVPLIVMFCTCGDSLNPGESLIVPPLALHVVLAALAEAALNMAIAQTNAATAVIVPNLIRMFTLREFSGMCLYKRRADE
jgi:hypothetical protein